MSRMTPFYFHVGMYRTATTTFQQSLFQRHSEIDYWGKPFPHPDLDRLITSIACHDSARYDPEEMRRIVSEQGLARREQGRVPLFSQELMASYGSTDTGVVAGRLQELFGDCRVIVSLRRQDSLLLSYYLQTAFKKYNAYMPLRRWLERQYRFRDYHDSVLHLLEYDGLVRVYEDAFGADNVLAIPFEQFVADRDGYLQRLCGFMDISSDEAAELLAGQLSNVSKGEGYQRAMRIRKAVLPWERTPSLDALLVRLCELVWRRPGHGMKLSDKWRTTILKDYVDGNKRLSERHGLNLKAYGYY